MLRCHILPAFGSHRLDAITRTEVKGVRPLPLRPAGAGHRAQHHHRARPRLREAIDDHYLLFDPTARLRLRDGPGEPRPTATTEEVRHLAARMPNLHTHVLIVTAAYTGMRFGELAGLTRSHVHLDQALIHISAGTGALHEIGGNRWLGPPKTKSAVRDIRLPPFLVDGLDIERVWRPACDGHPS
jgi:integrase